MSSINNNNNNNNVPDKKGIRKKIFSIIEVAESGDYLSLSYDIMMIIAVTVSILPLAFKGSYEIFKYTDYITVSIFIMDYLLRLFTADFKIKYKHSWLAFFRYPFTIWAIIDLFSILPSLAIINEGFKIVRVINLIRTFKIIRIFKAFRYSKSVLTVAEVIKNSKNPLMAVGTLSIGYILTSALIIYNVESDSFDTFFDAIYWATVSLTTVGYGDIYPVTQEGKIIAMISSLFGIALVALPSGIITAGYMDSINERYKNKKHKRTETAENTESVEMIENGSYEAINNESSIVINVDSRRNENPTEENLGNSSVVINMESTEQLLELK